MERSQEQSSVRATTWKMERQNSPTSESAMAIGRKATMVVREEVSSGSQSSRTAPAHAASLSSPLDRRTRMFSLVTMPLSTSMPRAMISEAMETLCSLMSNCGIRAMHISMAMGTSSPAISPRRSPANTSITSTT